MATTTTTPAAAPAPFASASLYVGDLAPEVTESLLFEIFNAVGPVASVRVCRDAATRRSLGYAYVNFHRVEDAELALDTMNFKAIRGKACRIMWSHRDPSLRKSGLGNIFVKNLAKSIDNKTLYDTFSMFGNILSCKVALDAKREPVGYGFVHYESEEAAQNAIARVDGKRIADQIVNVAAFKTKKERGGATKFKFTNVFVKNLPEDFKKEKMDELFSKFGVISSSMLAADKEGKNRGFGFINFSTPDEAAAAVEGMENFEVDGKALFVGRAQKKDEREKDLREKFEALKVERQKKFAGVNLYVKNLADNVDDKRLREEFTKFGSITSCRVMRDAQDKSRGFGFVCFATPDEATRAVTEMNNTMVESKPLYVALAQRKEARRAQLEAQHAARAKLGIPQPQMYPQQGPMFYQTGPHAQRVVYPQTMVPRRWNPSQGPHMMGVRGGQPMANYQLMPAMNGGRGGPQGAPNRGGRRGQRNSQQGKRMPQNGQPNVKYADNVRNRTQAAPGGAQVPATDVAQAQAAVPQPVTANAPLTIKALAAAPEREQTQMIGERLFPLIRAQQPELAGKITGMLLEMDNSELIHLLESETALNEKISEALQVLHSHAEPDAVTAE